MKRIIVNGQPRDTTATDLAALVAELGFAAGTVLVEHNGTALRPAEWPDCVLGEKDRVELLRIAAGG